MLINRILSFPPKKEARKSLKFSGDEKENFAKPTSDLLLNVLEGEVEVLFENVRLLVFHCMVFCFALFF